MKNPEQSLPQKKAEKISIPEEVEKKVPYHEVQKVVQSLKLDNYEQFKFNHQTHQLIFCDEEHGQPIEFHQSTELDGCDIYIWQSIKEKGDSFFRILMAHELAEIAIWDILPANEKKKAHAMALLYEKQFCMELLNTQQQQEYEIFSKKLREKEYEE